MCCVHLSVITVLRKRKKNVFKYLTQKLKWSYSKAKVDVAERIWRWYCRGYELVSNVVTAFEYHVWKILECVCGEL